MVARALVAAVLIAGVASADPAPKPVDITAMKDEMVVLKDADGGIYVVYFVRDKETHVFYGTGRDKRLYDQLLEGPKSRDGDGWSISTQAPRAVFPFLGQVARRKDGTFLRDCSDKDRIELTEQTGTKAKEILDKYQFVTTSVVRRPYLLARDDRGVYYYVDVLRDVYGGNAHRVFVGKKGGLKQMALTDVTSDSAGDVFSTKTGDLRLVRTFDESKGTDKPTAQWIRGEKKRDLIYLDIYMNQPLIYRDLGLYKVAGTICGNI
jgi:hypothetical protein